MIQVQACVYDGNPGTRTGITGCIGRRATNLPGEVDMFGSYSSPSSLHRGSYSASRTTSLTPETALMSSIWPYCTLAEMIFAARVRFQNHIQFRPHGPFNPGCHSGLLCLQAVPIGHSSRVPPIPWWSIPPQRRFLLQNDGYTDYIRIGVPVTSLHIFHFFQLCFQ